ncbi:MAG: dihydrofolate synthase, partial [Salinibacterium sp.]
MRDRDDEPGSGRDDEFDERDLGDDDENPLADLSPFAGGNEGDNLDDDSPWELEDAEYQEDADRVYAELLARIGEAAPQPRLEATRRAVELLGDPQRTYPIIHVTGTNGKTSTSRMIESILRAYGLRTGLMTSPHLVRVNERIVIDGLPISNRALAENWADVRPYLLMVDAELVAEGHPPLTFFEAFTVLAFAAFADAPVDIAVIEVGLGGEWDSTNVADGQVAVFGPVALDHTQRLGSTVAEIARTKAGIVKPVASVVSAMQTPDALAELERAAELTESTLAIEGIGFSLESSTIAVGGQVITVRGLAGLYPDLFLPLFGDHQGHNAALAIAAVESFLGSGTQALVGDVLAEGLATATSPGRLQLIGTDPTVLVDAAHNPHGAAALVAALASYFTFDEICIVIGVLNDKDARGIVAALAPVATRFHVTQS